MAPFIDGFEPTNGPRLRLRVRTVRPDANNILPDKGFVFDAAQLTWNVVLPLKAAHALMPFLHNTFGEVLFQDAAAPYTVAVMSWTEYERGYGQRPDDISLHPSADAFHKYWAEISAQMPKTAPDCYNQPDSNTPHLVTVEKGSPLDVHITNATSSSDLILTWVLSRDRAMTMALSPRASAADRDAVLKGPDNWSVFEPDAPAPPAPAPVKSTANSLNTWI